MNYEGELVVVIGKQAKHLTEANAFSCVFGYTIGNDVSERTWQRGDRTFWRGKNTDTFKPMGPWIETDVDLDAMDHHRAGQRRGEPALQDQRHDLRYPALISRR